MLPEHARRYLLHALSGTPVVVDRLLREAGCPLGAADYDRRPDPERFSIREVLAHLAEWEPIWRERFEAILREDTPPLASYDEGQLAIDHDYAHADPDAQRAAFRAGRAELVRLLESASPEDWDRRCLHAQWGSMSLGDLATLVLGHDGYHTRQISEWLDAGA